MPSAACPAKHANRQHAWPRVTGLSPAWKVLVPSLSKTWNVAKLMSQTSSSRSVISWITPACGSLYPAPALWLLGILRSQTSMTTRQPPKPVRLCFFAFASNSCATCRILPASEERWRHVLRWKQRGASDGILRPKKAEVSIVAIQKHDARRTSGQCRALPHRESRNRAYQPSIRGRK